MASCDLCGEPTSSNLHGVVIFKSGPNGEKGDPEPKHLCYSCLKAVAEKFEEEL